MSAVNELMGYFPDLESRHFKFLDKTEAMLLLISSLHFPYKNCKELKFKTYSDTIKKNWKIL